MRKLALLAALLAVPAVANAAASTMTYSSSTGRWIATCPAASGVAACTLDCTNSPIAVSCSDTDTCAFTLDENHTYFDTLARRTVTAFKENDECEVVNRGSNNVTFANSSGVQELDATVTMPQYTIKKFVYSNARWTGKAPQANLTVTGDQTITGDLTVQGGDFIGVTGGIDIGEATANTITLSRTTAGTVTVTAADNDATAALTILPGGAAAMVLGGASTTSNSILSNTANVLVGTTANTVVLSRLTSGTVTLTAADDDANAALIVAPGGTGTLALGNATTPTIGIGGAAMTALTVTSSTTGTGTVVLPNGAIGVPELTRPGHWSFQICGDAVTVNANTIYYPPSQVIASSATVGQRTCNTTQAGNATEASGNAAVLTGQAFGVTSMVCTSDNPGVASGLTFTLRSASAGLTPAVSCVVANGAAGSCVANAQTTVDIASAAAIDVSVASAQDVGTVHFICDVDAVF